MKGEVVYLYAYDVANEIATDKVQQILTTRPAPVRIRTDHTYPKDVPLYQPLTIEPERQAAIGGRPVRLVLRIYDVGVVSITVRVPVEVGQLADLQPLHSRRLDNGQTLDELAGELCLDACKSLGDAMIESSPPTEPEAYTVFCLTEIDGTADGTSGGATDVQQWLTTHRRAVAGLLSETDPARLSEEQVRESFRVERSFSLGDVVIIDWDAALLVDLDGYVDDVLYILELANVQLEEYRRMDERLDKYLNRAYEEVQQHRFGIFGTYTSILRKLRLFRVDVTKLSDEVSHIGKFLGDWFLARVYLGASERFYLEHWRTSVEQRLDQLDKLYNVVNSEVMNRRLLWLECLIVVFFAIDLALLVLLRR